MRTGTMWMRGAVLAGLLLAVGAWADGTVSDEYLWVDDLGTMKQVRVYLPEGYDADDDATRYPVAFFLHGGYTTPASYPMLIDALDATIWTGAAEPPEGYVHPLIVIMPDGNSFDYSGMSWWADSPVHGNYRSWISEDLVAWVDGQYNTIADRDHRGVFGHSMGGCGAMRAALLRPDVFAGVVTHGGVIDFTTSVTGIAPWVLDENSGAGPFSPDAGVWSEVLFSMAAAFSPNLDNEPDPVDLPITDDGQIDPAIWPDWVEDDPPQLARVFTPATQPAIYLQVGEDDLLWIDVCQALADSLSALGLDYRHDVHPGDHNNALEDRFPHTLAFFDSLFTASTAVPDQRRGQRPGGFELTPAYPNPWNASTRCAIDVPRPTHLRVDLVNTLGQAVAPVFNAAVAAGRTPLAIAGDGLPSGVYLLRATADGAVIDTQRLVLLR